MQTIETFNPSSGCDLTRQLLAQLRSRSETATAVRERSPEIRVGLFPGAGALVPRNASASLAVRSVSVNRRALAPSRRFQMNGSTVTVPIGAAKRLTVAALKALAGVDGKSVVFIRRADGDVRLEDGDVVEIRQGVASSFASAVPWTTVS